MLIRNLVKKYLLSRFFRVAVFIVNYNMLERADKIFEYISENSRWPVDIYLIDNGSDIQKPSKHTNVWIKKNVQTCRGWLRGLEQVRKSGKKYFAYSFLITSASFSDNIDPISPMVKFLILNRSAIGIHPALTVDSTTNWTHLITRGGSKPRQTWMIDNICSMYKSRWFDRIGWFDKRLIYAWGIDLETCYIARKENRSIWVDERVKVSKVTNIAYRMNRMNMKASERERLAGENMREVLQKKYGPDYWNIVMNENVSKSWR